jgi:hypothetical protein
MLGQLSKYFGSVRVDISRHKSHIAAGVLLCATRLERSHSVVTLFAKDQAVELRFDCESVHWR